MTQDIYSTSQVTEWRENLKVLATEPRTTFTKKEVVASLLDEITVALSSHSYETVADKMRKWGLEITAGSLKQYVTRLNRARKGKSNGKRWSGEKRAIAEQTQATPNLAIVNQEQSLKEPIQTIETTVEKVEEKTESGTKQAAKLKSNKASEPSKSSKQVAASTSTDKKVSQGSSLNSTEIRPAY
jgi:transcription initiation factor IIF auxiliary subunit